MVAFEASLPTKPSSSSLADPVIQEYIKHTATRSGNLFLPDRGNKYAVRARQQTYLTAKDQKENPICIQNNLLHGTNIEQDAFDLFLRRLLQKRYSKERTNIYLQYFHL